MYGQATKPWMNFYHQKWTVSTTCKDPLRLDSNWPPRGEPKSEIHFKELRSSSGLSEELLALPNASNPVVCSLLRISIHVPFLCWGSIQHRSTILRWLHQHGFMVSHWKGWEALDSTSIDPKIARFLTPAIHWDTNHGWPFKWFEWSLVLKPQASKILEN
jgi:hypothetical protein